MQHGSLSGSPCAKLESNRELFDKCSFSSKTKYLRYYQVLTLTAKSAEFGFKERKSGKQGTDV